MAARLEFASKRSLIWQPNVEAPPLSFPAPPAIHDLLEIRAARCSTLLRSHISESFWRRCSCICSDSSPTSVCKATSPRSPSIAYCDRSITACWPQSNNIPALPLNHFMHSCRSQRRQRGDGMRRLPRRCTSTKVTRSSICQLMHAATQVYFPADAKEAGAQFQAG